MIYQASLTSSIRPSRNIRRASVSRICNISPKRNRNITYKGLINGKITKKLNISRRTVEYILSNLYHFGTTTSLIGKRGPKYTISLLYKY